MSHQTNIKTYVKSIETDLGSCKSMKIIEVYENGLKFMKINKDLIKIMNIY